MAYLVVQSNSKALTLIQHFLSSGQHYIFAIRFFFKRIQGYRNENFRHNTFAFEPEFTAKALKRHFRIFEVPITFNPRDYTQGKKIKLRDAFEAVWTLIKYRFI